MKKLGKGLLFGCAVGIPLALMAFLVLSHRHGDCTLGSERIIAQEAQGESPEHLPEAGTPGAGDRQEGSSPSSGEQEPSSPEGPAEETDNASSVRLLFAGDILFTEVPLSRYRSGGIGTFVSDAVLEEMERADIFMLNEEFPFSTRGTAAPDKQFTFQVDPSHVSIFQELSVDVATIANNHALDFGTDAFLDTLDTLDKAGIARVGGGRNREEAASPAILEAGGMRIAFFRDLWEGLMANPDAVVYLLEFVLVCVMALALSITMAYLSMSIGHLFRRRILMSVAAFIALDILGTVYLDFLDRLDLPNILNDGSHAALLGSAAMMLPLILLFTAGTIWILGHRLNLE